MSYNIQKITSLLSNAFNDIELSTFCQSHFWEVYNNFTAEQNKAQKILALIDHCQRKELMDTLLELMEKENKVQYKTFLPYLTNENDFCDNNLNIIILAASRENIFKQFENMPIKEEIYSEDYGEIFYEWKPFRNEANIQKILSYYSAFSGFNCSYISSAQVIDNKTELLKIISKVVFISDNLSLYNTTNFDEIVACCNNQPEVPTLLIPICKDKSEGLKKLMREVTELKFKDYYKYYTSQKELSTEYVQIELELPTIHDFYRKLTNIAILKNLVKKKIKTIDETYNSLRETITTTGSLIS